ncbi:MAG: hypothetical protein KJ604_20820 [Gammaproteobacteria bacterium]|nr:hypothetical protein [Gammaproteobacteria bacterium]
MGWKHWVKKEGESDNIFTDHAGDLPKDEIMSIYGLNKAVLAIIRKLGYKLDTRSLPINGCGFLSPRGPCDNDDLCSFHEEFKLLKMQIATICEHLGIELEYRWAEEKKVHSPAHYKVHKVMQKGSLSNER